MTKLAIVAKLTTKPGKRAEFTEITSDFISKVEADEEGTEVYALAEAAGDENVAWMFEVYADDDAFAAHGTTEAMVDFIGKIAPLLDGAPELVQTRIVRAKGIDIPDVAEGS